jgi:hypothetical protein
MKLHPYPSAMTSPPPMTVTFPEYYFFKGFLAWYLWGLTSILPGSMMKSFLFLISSVMHRLEGR